MTYKEAIEKIKEIKSDIIVRVYSDNIKALDIAIKLLENAQMHEDNLAVYMKDFNVSREQAEWDLTVAKQENTICYSDGCKKLRDKDYVLYNVEWLKENYRQELDLMGIESPVNLEDKHIAYTSKNGYTGIFYGEKSLVIRDKYDNEVLHTGNRNIKTIDELIELVDNFPEVMKGD